MPWRSICACTENSPRRILDTNILANGRVDGEPLGPRAAQWTNAFECLPKQFRFIPWRLLALGASLQIWANGVLFGWRWRRFHRCALGQHLFEIFERRDEYRLLFLRFRLGVARSGFSLLGHSRDPSVCASILQFAQDEAII